MMATLFASRFLIQEGYKTINDVKPESMRQDEGCAKF